MLNDAVGIEKGFMTTIHSYTNDQPSLDQMHKDLYRARAAALRMIPTSTGAAKAVGLVLPDLNGKLDGISIRVPTPNVSVVDFKFIAKRATTKDEINDAIQRAAEQQLKGILGYTDGPNVSIDFNHDPHSSTFHLDQTKVMDGTLRARDVLVRQRVGLLEPHGGHRRRDGEADLKGVPMTAFRTLDDADLKGKRVLVRVDLNVPMENGRVTDATRIERVLPTIREIAEKGGRVVLLAHFGRPKGRDPKDSLKPVAAVLAAASRPAGRLRGGLVGEVAAKAVAAPEGRRRAAPREHPLPRRRGEERPGLREGARASSATSTSTTPSRPPTGRMPRPRASPACCRPMRAAPCRRSSTR